MENIKKQPKAMFYVPGIIAICMGIAVLGIDTPDRTIRFGADFYTEAYQAIAEIAYVIKTVTAYVLFALGALSLGKGMTEAKRSDLMFEELGAIREALEEIKSREMAGAPAEVASRTPGDAPAEVAPSASAATPSGTDSEASAEAPSEAAPEASSTPAEVVLDVSADAPSEMASEASADVPAETASQASEVCADVCGITPPLEIRGE